MEIIIDNIRLHYEEYGEGIPAICIHGFGVDLNLMKGCLEPVFKQHSGYKRIYLDLIGMGKTPANEDVKNSDDVLGVVAGFVAQIVGTEKFILMGESFGGYLSLGLLQQFKNQISGIFLICPCVIGDSRKRNLPPRQIIKQATVEISKGEERDYRSFLEMAVIANEYTWKRYREEILPGIKSANMVYLNSLPKEEYTLSCENDFTKVIFENPAIFVLGRQDNVVGYQDALALEPCFPRGTFVVMDSAGHNLQIEKPNLFSAFLEDFLEQIE